MNRFTGPQRAFCVRAYYKNNDSYTMARRLYKTHFNLTSLKHVPSANLIKHWVSKFEETGNTMPDKSSGRKRTSRTDINVDRVRQSLLDDPRQSLRLRAASLNLNRSTVHRIIKKDLHFHPYKIVIVQEMKPDDPDKRVKFCKTMKNRFRSFNNIWFSDESNFHINGHVNKQNCRYWAAENPLELHQKPLHSPKVVVWAAISSQGIIGPYFFEDDRGRTQTVNSERYCHMIRTFLATEMQSQSGYNRNTFFQQDGATSHVTNDSLAALHDLFPGRVISRRGDINWPPRSPDLTPADFFLWGYLKSKVYNPLPPNLNVLKQRITEEINSISRAMLQRVIENFSSRLNECEQVNGAHLPTVVFHK